jgi:lactoylglutathione lyase
MADGTASPRLDHAGLSVADLEAAERWYCAVFGYDRELLLRVDPIDLDIVMLIHREHGDRLELLRRPGSAVGPGFADPKAAASSQGFGHIAFDVDGLEDTYATVIAAGARPVMPPGPSPEAGVRMAYVADPEANLVELLDRRHRSTPANAGGAP